LTKKHFVDDRHLYSINSGKIHSAERSNNQDSDVQGPVANSSL
ncbi:hypothetical protein AVEN_85297-1, partial [Araneus ventricosus]